MFDKLPEIIGQIPQYNFPVSGFRAPVPWQAMLANALAPALGKFAEQIDPHEKTKREIEKKELEYRLRKLDLLNSGNGQHLKPDGTPYSEMELLQMERTRQLIDDAKKKHAPPAGLGAPAGLEKFSDNTTATGMPVVSLMADNGPLSLPRGLPTTSPEDWANQADEIPYDDEGEPLVA